MEKADKSARGGTLARAITIVKQDNSHSSGVITISYPYEDRVRGHWSCDVMISEILPKQTLCGEDALQTLLFALNHARTHVQIAKNHGVILYWTKEGDMCGLGGDGKGDEQI